MIKKITGLFFCCIMISEDSKLLDLKTFSLQTPNHWVYIPRRGIDSFVGDISIGSGDTLHFDYGYYSSSLKESLDYYISNDSVYFSVPNENKNDTVNRFVYKFHSLKKNFNINDYYKQSYYFETIDGKKAKISIPKKDGNGFTGVFFESASRKYKNIRLQISGDELTTENQKDFLKALKTLRFKS